MVSLPCCILLIVILSEIKLFSLRQNKQIKFIFIWQLTVVNFCDDFGGGVSTFPEYFAFFNDDGAEENDDDEPDDNAEKADMICLKDYWIRSYVNYY